MSKHFKGVHVKSSPFVTGKGREKKKLKKNKNQPSVSANCPADHVISPPTHLIDGARTSLGAELGDLSFLELSVPRQRDLTCETLPHVCVRAGARLHPCKSKHGGRTGIPLRI